MTIYQHIFDSSLLPSLIAHLPSSIPLLGRLQSQQRSPSSLVLSTFPPSSVVPDVFTAAYVDQSRRNESQAWIYCSLEAKFPVGGKLDEGMKEILRSQVRELLLYIKFHPPVSLSPLPSSVNDVGNQTVEYDSLRLASLSPLLVDAVQAISKVPLNPSNPWLKYIFRGTLIAGEDEVLLPAGIHYGKLRPEDMDSVVATSSIPRSAQTMRLLKNVAIFTSSGSGETAPLAWCFISLEGSLGTWWVEESWRGKGLGKAVARKILGIMREDRRKKWAKEEVELWDKDGVWGHADVALGNTNSRRGLEKLGAKAGWEARWVTVGLKEIE